MIWLTSDATEEQIAHIRAQAEKLDLGATLVKGEHEIALQLIGDETGKDIGALAGLPGVKRVQQIDLPYKLVSREHHPEYEPNGHSAVVDVNGVKIGKDLVMIAGPCTIYSEQQIVQAAIEAKEAGANILRGGAYKPRTSPHSFQGLGQDGIKMLLTASQETGLPIVTEVTDPRQLEFVVERVHMLQIGARNMQNYELLAEVGRSGKPVLLKRHFSANLDDWLAAADYIAAKGNYDIVLCERGMKAAYQSAPNGRFNIDIQAVPAVKKLSFLPIIVDPSHAAGQSKYLVEPISLAAVAVGAHGLIVETRRESDGATITYRAGGEDRQAGYCDYPQALVPNELSSLVGKVKYIHAAVNGEPTYGMVPRDGVSAAGKSKAPGADAAD